MGTNLDPNCLTHLSRMNFPISIGRMSLYPTKKETHHLELFNSQEDQKGKASLVCISAKVCQVLLHHTSYANWRQKCVKENWS